MRIALTHPYSWVDVRRGAERVLRETARSLAARGHDVTVLTSGSASGWSTIDGVKVKTFKRRHRRVRLHERWFAAAIVPSLVRGRFDVIHSLMPADALSALRAGRLTGARCVYEDIAIPFAGDERSADDVVMRERLARRAHVYGCMSHVALDGLARHTGRRGVLIPGGVSLVDFPALAERDPCPTVLFSGTLNVRFKRLPLLLAAMDRVLVDEPDSRLQLSGPGDPTDLLAAATPPVRAVTEVLGLGELADQPGRYRRAWVTALPSVGESFGLVLLESLASGTPIVTSDRGAAPELVRDGAGFVTTADDAASLTAGLLDAIDLARRHETVARCRAVAAEFDWSEIAARLEAIYSE